MESDILLMGNWPDPVSGNKEITVVGPRTDIGGLALELQALSYPSGSSTVALGASYYFPFQVHHYWTPTAIALTQSPNPFWLSNNISFIIQLAIYAEIGDTSAKQIVTTTPWETRGQASTYNTHNLSTVLRLPPGGYYVGYQNASASSSSNTSCNGYGVTSNINRAFGVRESASGFQSVVTDLGASNMGIPVDLMIKTQ